MSEKEELLTPIWTSQELEPSPADTINMGDLEWKSEGMLGQGNPGLCTRTHVAGRGEEQEERHCNGQNQDLQSKDMGYNPSSEQITKAISATILRL